MSSSSIAFINIDNLLVIIKYYLLLIFIVLAFLEPLDDGGDDVDALVGDRQVQRGVATLHSLQGIHTIDDLIHTLKIHIALVLFAT